MSPWHLSQKPKPEMGWDESYVFRLIFTRNQVDDQKEEVKLSSSGDLSRFLLSKPCGVPGRLAVDILLHAGSS